MTPAPLVSLRDVVAARSFYHHPALFTTWELEAGLGDHMWNLYPL